MQICIPVTMLLTTMVGWVATKVWHCDYDGLPGWFHWRGSEVKVDARASDPNLAVPVNCRSLATVGAVGADEVRPVGADGVRLPPWAAL
jgi:hypothetical protein